MIQPITLTLRFLQDLAISILTAVMYLIPWILRAVSIVVWLIAVFIGITTLHDIYSPFTEAVPMFALQFGVVLLMAQWAMYGLRNGNNIWGLLFTGAITLWVISEGATWLSINWQYADLFYRILPPAILGVGMITVNVRARSRRMSTRRRHQTTRMKVST